MSLSGDPQSYTNFSLKNIESYDIPPPTITFTTTASSSLDEAQDGTDGKANFAFLELPFELRLKIYSYLLPPRKHTIVTTMPPTTYFYNSLSFPITSPLYSPSTYPFGHSSPLSASGVPTPVHYKVLTNYPSSSISPAILRTCKQIHREAEEVLYAGKGVQWDFGVHLEAIRAFWGERSSLARSLARNLRIAFELPVSGNWDHRVSEERKGRKTVVWERMVKYLLTEMTGVRHLDLTMWCSDGSEIFPSLVPISPMPSALSPDPDSHCLLENEKAKMFDVETQWRKNPWTETVLSLASLRSSKITVWMAGLPKIEPGGVEGMTIRAFDSWVAGRMVGDATVRGRMVVESFVKEEVFMLGPTTRIQMLQG